MTTDENYNTNPHRPVDTVNGSDLQLAHELKQINYLEIRAGLCIKRVFDVDRKYPFPYEQWINSVVDCSQNLET